MIFRFPFYAFPSCQVGDAVIFKAEGWLSLVHPGIARRWVAGRSQPPVTQPRSCEGRSFGLTLVMPANAFLRGLFTVLDLFFEGRLELVFAALRRSFVRSQSFRKSYT